MRPGTSPYPAGSDEQYMHEALALALGGLGWVSPNPLVGCLLVRDGQVIGRGFHARDGREHAEVRALAEAGGAAGATCYVTLEPCSQIGRQPSCCGELAKAGVSRVVWGCDDTDPRNGGQAHGVLLELGLETASGVLRERCTELLDYYLHGHVAQRPFLHLKLALSLDGKTACPGGHSQWLSGPESLGYAHFLRLKYDAVLVGYRTVLADDPRLTARAEVLGAYFDPPSEATLRQPVRVVLDPRFEVVPRLGQLRLSDFAGAFREHLPRLIVAGDEARLPAEAPPRPEARVLGLKRAPGGRLPFADLAAQLWELGVRSVLAEGGGALAAELLRQHAADKLTLVYTPTLIGADGDAFTPALGSARVEECPRLVPVSARVLGTDALLEGYPVWDAPSRDGAQAAQ